MHRRRATGDRVGTRGGADARDRGGDRGGVRGARRDVRRRGQAVALPDVARHRGRTVRPGGGNAAGGVRAAGQRRSDRGVPREPSGPSRGSGAVLPRPRCRAGAGSARRGRVRALRDLSVVGGERARHHGGRSVGAAVAAGGGGAGRSGRTRAATRPRAPGDAPRLHLRAAAGIRDGAGLSRVRSPGGMRGVRRRAPLGRGHGSLHRVRGAGAMRALRGGRISGSGAVARNASRSGRRRSPPSRSAASPREAGLGCRERRRSSSAGRSRCVTSAPATSTSSRSSMRISRSGGPGWRRASGPWPPGWRRWDGRAPRAERSSRPTGRATPRSKRWCAATRIGSMRTRERDARRRGSRSGPPCSGSSARMRSKPSSRTSDPITMLVSSVGEQTVCLLALEPGRVDGVRSHDP